MNAMTEEAFNSCEYNREHFPWFLSRLFWNFKIKVLSLHRHSCWSGMCAVEWWPYMIRRLLTLCSWHLETSQLSYHCREWSNGGCPWVCIHQPAVYLIIYRVCQRCDIHTGVGFCVARSTVMGNAKASKCGTGDGKDSHAFCVYDEKLMLYKTYPTLGIFSDPHK